MEITIKKSILHVLDTDCPLPVLSNSEFQLNQELTDYISFHIEKTFSDDACKQCELLSDSYFKRPFQDFIDDFLEVTQNIASQIFVIMHRNREIPPADLLFCIVDINGSPYLSMLKLDYKESFIHHVTEETEKGRVDLICYRSMLPSSSSKVTEAFFVSNENTVKVFEKRYQVDGVKDFYLSSYILLCTQEMSPKQKVQKVLKVAREVNESHYSLSDNMDAYIAEVIHNSANDNLVIDKLGEDFYGDNDNAKHEFINKLEKIDIKPNETVNISDKLAKRFEKQSIKSKSGVEIKIPIDLFRQPNDGIKFINNPDGTISLLIRNLIM